MFLLKQGRTVVLLVTIFGMILLPDLYAQPAQAEGEVQAEVVPDIVTILQRRAKAKVQSGAAPAKASGPMCYQCERCTSNTDLGNVTQCDPDKDTCIWGEVRFQGVLQPFRSCAPSAEADNLPCDTFIAEPSFPGVEVRVCSCKWDLCNSQDATDTVVITTTTTPGSGSSSSSAQPIFFRILVAASIYGFLMIK